MQWNESVATVCRLLDFYRHRAVPSHPRNWHPLSGWTNRSPSGRTILKYFHRCGSIRGTEQNAVNASLGSWKPVKSRFERLRITSKVHELSEQFDRRLSTVRVESGHVQIVDEEDLLSKQRWPVHVFAPFRQFFVDQILFIADEPRNHL